MWNEPEIDYFNGFVALSDDFVAQKGLPSAMRYPWDKTKSIYVFHSYHSLHCVVSTFSKRTTEYTPTDSFFSLFSAKRSCSGMATRRKRGSIRMSLTAFTSSAKTPCVMQTTHRGILGLCMPRKEPLTVSLQASAKCECVATGRSLDNSQSKTQHVIDGRWIILFLSSIGTSFVRMGASRGKRRYRRWLTVLRCLASA